MRSFEIEKINKTKHDPNRAGIAFEKKILL